MTRDEVKEKIIDIVADRIGKDRSVVREESSLSDDLGCDSLDIAEINMNVQEEFQLQVNDAENPTIKTVKDAIDYVMKTKD